MDIVFQSAQFSLDIYCLLSVVILEQHVTVSWFMLSEGKYQITGLM